MNPRSRLVAGRSLLAALVACLAAGPLFLFTTGYALDVARLGLYLALLSSTWSFLAGVAGQFSFAHVATAALGGYAGAIWSTRLLGHGWIAGAGPSIAFGVAFGTVVGALLGLLLQRLVGAYLALFTIAFAEVARLVVVAESDLTGGRLSLVVRPGLPGSDSAHYYVMFVLALVTIGGIYALMRTPFGLNLRAMREDTVAAAAMGVNVRMHKFAALTLAAALTALAGSVYFHTVDRIAPEELDLVLMSQVIAYAVIGGLESPLAAGLAAMLGSLVLENLREVRLDSDQVLLLAFAVGAVPLALAVVVTWRTARGPSRRRVLSGARAAVPWAVPGFALFAWWLFAPGSYSAGQTGGYLTLLAALVLVARAGAAARGREPASSAAVSTALLAVAGLLLGRKLYSYLSIDADLGVWRLAVFGALLAITLRFASNGLFTPVFAWFGGADRRRALAVAHRDVPAQTPVPEEVAP